MKSVAVLVIALLVCACASRPTQVVPVSGGSDVFLVGYEDSRNDYYMVPAPPGLGAVTEAQKAEAMDKATAYCKHNLSQVEVLADRTNQTRSTPAVTFRCIGGR
jgi:hypothetical protein